MFCSFNKKQTKEEQTSSNSGQYTFPNVTNQQKKSCHKNTQVDQGYIFNGEIKIEDGGGVGMSFTELEW